MGWLTYYLRFILEKVKAVALRTTNFSVLTVTGERDKSLAVNLSG